MISKAIEHLRVTPVDQARKYRETYSNGGYGFRDFDVPLFKPSVAEKIRNELRANGVALGDGRFRCRNTTFRWTGEIG